tara:strand:+ start:1371 stop:1625 length:255 start_codon:yes stop_codon:yes gene_type:complete
MNEIAYIALLPKKRVASRDLEEDVRYQPFESIPSVRSTKIKIKAKNECQQKIKVISFAVSFKILPILKDKKTINIKRNIAETNS